jgi:hypothetical protein
MPKAREGFGDCLTNHKGATTMTHNIFEIRDNLKIWGFHYVLWTQGLSLRTLYSIWVAYGMIRHDRIIFSLKG